MCTLANCIYLEELARDKAYRFLLRLRGATHRAQFGELVKSAFQADLIYFLRALRKNNFAFLRARDAAVMISRIGCDGVVPRWQPFVWT